MNNISKTRRVH